MASITREIEVAVPAAAAWARVRDVAHTHHLFAGVLTDCKMEEGARVVTFANGMVVRELIVDIDEARHRVAYAAVGGRATHHNASLQVIPDGDGARIVWTLDFLPAELAPFVGGLVEAGSAAMKASLEAGVGVGV